MSAHRLREPSLQVCANECGARCCHGMVAHLSKEEGERLRRLDHRAWIRPMAPLEQLRHGGRPDLVVLMDFREGACVFLHPDKTCGIYDQRPSACQAFPRAPHHGCLVWPVESEVAAHV